MGNAQGFGAAGGMSSLQGLSLVGGAAAFPVQQRQGLNLSQVQQLQQQQNTAARDLLTRMQFANSNEVAAQVAQQQQGISQGQQQQAQDSNTPDNNNTNNNSSSSNQVTGANATGEEILQLQMEQERHNRMIQMVQNDRQERAIMANHRRQSSNDNLPVGNVASAGGDNGDNTATNNDNGKCFSIWIGEQKKGDMFLFRWVL